MAELNGATRVQKDMEEEEEELFEINLEAVNYTMPPPHHWECCFAFTATSDALLANCLLPKSDVSSAVPMVSKASELKHYNGLSSSVIAVAESMPARPLELFPSFGAYAFYVVNK